MGVIYGCDYVMTGGFKIGVTVVLVVTPSVFPLDGAYPKLMERLEVNMLYKQMRFDSTMFGTAKGD